MLHTPSVTVYAFRVFGQHVECPHVMGCKGTKEAIRKLEGDPIQGTEEEVPASAVDHDGLYRRLPTGWGELS